MLAINPVNYIRNFNYNFQNNKKSSSVYAPKLQPLLKDTVSFKGARTKMTIEEILKASKIDFNALEQNAVKAKEELAALLTETFSDLLVSDNNPDGFMSLVTRVKSSDSIREKVSSMIAETVLEDLPSLHFPLKQTESEANIKRQIDDIIGARIVLEEPFGENNAEIINRLIELVKDKRLKIKKIELIIPKHEQDSGNSSQISQYFTKDDLEKLQNAVNPNEKYSIKETETGYSALHIDLDLSDGTKFKTIYDGYCAELQIMGHDVAKLKTVEDLCYKVRQNKCINGGHPAYDSFVNLLNQYLKHRNPDAAKKYLNAFMKYTHNAYIIQRQKDKNAPNYDSEHLPTIKECGLQIGREPDNNTLPPELDFNNLKKVKQACDNLYRIAKEHQISDEKLSDIITYSSLYKDGLESTSVDPDTQAQITETCFSLYELTNLAA